MTFRLSAVAAGAALAVTTAASAQVTTYSGSSRIVDLIDCAEFCCLETFDLLNGYTEAGLVIDVDDFHFDFTPCGFPNEEHYYPNGAVTERISITRVDGNDFGRLEMNVSHGFAGCDINVWATALLDGVVVGDFAIDVAAGTLIGFEGGAFDQLLIGGYIDDATRDEFIESNSNAISLDNVCYEGPSGGCDLTLEFAGSCPGLAKVIVGGATPGGTVAVLYSPNTGAFTIPNGFTCAGTVLGLGSPVAIGATSTSGDEQRVFNPTLPNAACGLFIQAIDATTCCTSSVVQIP